MNNHVTKIAAMLTLLLAMPATPALAHTVGGPIDGQSNNASATDLGFVSCYDDGSGPADHLAVQIEDLSPPVDGLFASVQIMKADKNAMTNITDTISADGKPSPFVSLKGGSGSYYISVNKTKAGVRNFILNYHCLTSSEDHTGTEVGVMQLQ